MEVAYEGYLVVFLVLLEFPALVDWRHSRPACRWTKRAGGRLLHEVLSGKSIVLLVGGLLIGWLAGPEGIKPLDRLFLDLFKGVLAFFLLEMGLVVASRLGDLRKAGAFLIGFGIAMPLVGASLGLLVGNLLDLSIGGAVLLAALFASASYIAAPAAMRIAIPEANPALVDWRGARHHVSLQSADRHSALPWRGSSPRWRVLMTPTLHFRQLLTIICEADIERQLVSDLYRLGRAWTHHHRCAGAWQAR